MPIDVVYVGCVWPVRRDGAARVGTDIVVGLSGLGHRLRVVAPHTAEATVARARFVEQHADVRTAWFPVPISSNDLPEGSRDPRYRRAEDEGIRLELTRSIAERRPDVILIGRESTVDAVPPVARRHGIPMAVLVQGSRTIRRIVGGSRDVLTRRHLARLRQMDAVIVVARHLQRELAPLALRGLTVVPNAVDLERFAPGEKPQDLLRTHGIDPRHIVIGHVSNLGPVKRPMDVVESAALVLATSPRIVYLVIGDGPCRPSMEARCRELHIAERVRFAGWVEPADVPDYMRLFDIVVMPSEHEGLSLVYLETQASGRLLVASDIPAAREVIMDGQTGLVFRRGDIADLAAKILRAAGDPELRRTIGRAARAAVGAHARPVALRAYARILENVARTRHHASPDSGRVRASP